MDRRGRLDTRPTPLVWFDADLIFESVETEVKRAPYLAWIRRLLRLDPGCFPGAVVDFTLRRDVRSLLYTVAAEQRIGLFHLVQPGCPAVTWDVVRTFRVPVSEAVWLPLLPERRSDLTLAIRRLFMSTHTSGVFIQASKLLLDSPVSLVGLEVEGVTPVPDTSALLALFGSGVVG